MSKKFEGNRFMHLTDEELTRLSKTVTSDCVGESIMHKIWTAYEDRFPHKDFDGEAFPLQEMGSMVRCIHEGACPTCGRPTELIESKLVKVEKMAHDGSYEYVYQPHGLKSDTVVCSKGHKHTAEPTYIGDWVAW